jgi:hypothetical protein
MTEARLIVDAETLRSGSAGPSTGLIWVALDDVPFPMHGWNDFVVVILSAWTDALLRLTRAPSSRELVHFMDGPYAVELQLTSADMLRMSALKNQVQVASIDANALVLIESVLDGSEQVLAACRAQNRWSRDEEALSEDLPMLRREAMRLRRAQPS